MRICILALAAAGVLFAQETTTTVTTTLGASQQSAVIKIRPLTKLLPTTCGDVSEPFEPGESITCTVTLSQPARANGVLVRITLASELTGPPSVLIPRGATTATFTVTVSPTVTAAKLVIPGEASITGRAPEYYAFLYVPCCMRDDRCGLPAAQVSQLPCWAPTR